MKHSNLITAPFLALSLALASCASEEPLVNPDKDVVRSYEFTMFDSQNELNFSLIDINQPITRIESPFNWLDIAQGENDEMGFTRINVVRTKPTPKGFCSDDAYLYLANNKAIKVTISEGDIIKPLDDNSEDYEAFNKSWWEQDAIKYTVTTVKNGKYETVSSMIPLPWANSTKSHIPRTLFQDNGISANAGWTMAYNLFASTTNGQVNSMPYFILYNKFTGELRVFYYQFKGVGNAGELCFNVRPDSPTSDKYPFYNQLQYGIPMSNKEVPLKGNVLNILKGDNLFQQKITPLLKDQEDNTLKEGWYCFDLDMSAYNPETPSAFRSEDVLSIDILTTSTSQITLAGVMEGTSKGKIEGLTTSSNKGVSTFDIISSGAQNVKATVDAVVKKDYLGAIFKGGMTIYNLVKMIKQKNKKPEEVVPPTIELSHTGKISLNGYTTSSTSNDAIGVQFAYNAFAMNDDVCKGVWSLQDNPIVYVLDDVLLGKDEDLVVGVHKDGYLCGSENPEPNNLHLFTFLDPQSIKLNLNTKAFKNVRNVNICWTYGVYPNQPKGHTDIFRNGLLDYKDKGFLQEPIFITKEGNIGKTYDNSRSKFANMQYMDFSITDVPATRINSTTRATFYRQKDAKYRYYGHPGNNLSAKNADFFVVDPIVFLPCDLIKQNSSDKYGKGFIYDFEAPDYIVGVLITFDYTAPDGSETTACFSKRFLPEVRKISKQNLFKRLASLTEYSQSSVHQSIDGIEVSHGDIKPLMNRTIKTIEYIKNYK